jgi:hypothetical protein
LKETSSVQLPCSNVLCELPRNSSSSSRGDWFYTGVMITPNSRTATLHLILVTFQAVVTSESTLVLTGRLASGLVVSLELWQGFARKRSLVPRQAVGIFGLHSSDSRWLCY